MKTEYVYVIVNLEGRRVSTTYRGNGCYSSKGMAARYCPLHCRVVRLEVAKGEVVHEG